MVTMIMYRLNVTFLLICLINSAFSQDLYIGCYANFDGMPSNNNPIQSVSQCSNECRNQTSLFSAIKDGSSCYCGNTTNTRVPSSNCNLTCDDNNEICGGNNFYAIYTGVPTYSGCFIDDDPMDMDILVTNKKDGTMTLDKCYGSCLPLKYNFMGVMDRHICFCGQRYGKFGKAPEAECNTTCAADGSQICGGAWRNSIYSVGYIHGLNKNYSQVFHCLNGATDMHGTCTSKTCQPGWKGTKCNQRDCTLNNGDCGKCQCAEIAIGNQIISECVFNKRFQSNSIYDSSSDDRCYDDKQINEDKRFVILAIFLALSLCAAMISTSAVIFYICKNRSLNSKLNELLSNNIGYNPAQHNLHLTNEPLDDQYYTQIIA